VGVPVSLFRSVVLFVLIAAGPAAAVDALRLSLGSVHGPQWSAGGVVVTVSGLQTGAPALQVQAARVRLPGLGQSVTHLRLTCTQLHWDASRIQCRQGTFTATSPELPAPLSGGVAFDYRQASASLAVSLRHVAFAGGALTLEAHLSRTSWRADLRGTGLQAGKVLSQLQRHGLMKGYTGKGAVDLQLQVGGSGAQPGTLRLQARTHGVDFSNASGTRAGQDLNIDASAELTREGTGWAVHTALHARKGQVYDDPLYLEVPDRPIALQAHGRWEPTRKRLRVAGFRWEHPGVVDARGSAELALGKTPSLTALDLRVVQARLAGLYTNYVQPWALGTLGGDLDHVAGSLHGHVNYRNGALQSVDMHLADVSVHDKQGRFGLKGLAGDLDWGRDDVQRRSDFSWRSGSLYRIPLGPAKIALQSRGMRFSLHEAARIPVLDGDLLIDKATIEDAGTPHMAWDFTGVLTPVSLQAFTKAVGWMPLSGELSGVIPDVRYRNGVLTMGGVLLVRVFGGDITMRDVTMERPFGLVPRLQANIRVDRINLDTLTRTFSFGSIQGLLSGHVRNLHMVDWQPVSFDAAFATPPDDHTRHRISQKALNTLSNIGGGGVGGVLSRGFLRLFQDFPYDRLGISCRLHDGICDMNGVAPAKQGGYYIVKGRFLPPRVDVIGHAHEVDWNTLVQQLKAATRGHGPTVR